LNNKSTTGFALHILQNNEKSALHPHPNAHIKVISIAMEITKLSSLIEGVCFDFDDSLFAVFTR